MISFKRQFNHWKEIMEYTENGVPLFNGHNGLEYDMWSIRMRTFLKAHGYDILYTISIGYDATNKSKTTTKKELKKNNKIEMDFIQEGLPDPVREKVVKCSSTKEIWDKLHDIYFFPIIKLEFSKEDTSTKHEERCSSCHSVQEEEECEVTEANIGDLFFFNCEECEHIEIECP
jgi:hypothetical protein